MTEIKWILRKFFVGCVIIGLMWFLITVFRNTMMSYEYNAEGEDYIKKNEEYVDKYLDDAYLSGLKQVTIIHGKGTGALRTAIMQRLKRHPHVEAQRPGTFGEGEMGVTVVTIK